VSDLTLKQVHDIYYGKITNWKDVGGPDQPINVYAVASPGDGVEFSLRKLLFGRGGQPVAAPRLYVNTVQLESAVTLDPRSFGVTTLASVGGNPKVKMLRVDGAAPSTSAVASGSYPLFMELYLVTNPTSPNSAGAQAFVDFTKSAKGSAVLRAHRLLPYADGSALLAMDSSRRSRILAEVGAHASSEGGLLAGPTRAPAAAAVAAAVASGRAAPIPVPALTGVSGSVVAAPGISSIKGVHGEAFTVAAASSHGSDFTKVTADSFVTFSKVSSKSAMAATPIKTTRHTAVESKAVSKSKLASKTASVTAPKSAQTYRVGTGETLYSIARKHGVDVAQIRSWNHLKDNTVRPGQVLRVSAR
jgi:phosphate transport system substrate-binding protein